MKLCTRADLLDKKKIRVHNDAVKKQMKLEEQMMQEEDRCESLARELLEHPAERVRLCAASYCLRADFAFDDAIRVANKIRLTSSDATTQLSADYALLYRSARAKEALTKLYDAGEMTEEDYTRMLHMLLLYLGEK